MIHITMQGIEAGKPYCANSKVNLPANDSFTHMPYSEIAINKLLNDSELCPKCKAIYNLVLDDNLTDDEWNKQYTAILKGQ